MPRGVRDGGRVWALALVAAAMAVAVSLLAAGPVAAAAGASHYDTAAYAYDAPALLSSPDTGASDARGSPSGPEVASSVSPVSVRDRGVAANTAADVPTVVFSRSRAPGIAQNFDDAVANGAPTQLNRVSAAARDANRRAALRGQSPAPAGQSLDEYPFACSAQGGCGSFVRSVPQGEQSYQGGVLSRFFQNNGVGVGDPFNVVFGP